MSGVLEQSLKDAQYRHRIIETFWLFWSFVLIGFDNGILGPCLPDLQVSVGASLEQMSYVFFMQGSGALLGNVLGFLLERRFNRRLLMAVYVLAGSVINMLIPLVPSFPYLLGLFLLQGLSKGLADFGAMSLCNLLWEHNKALPFQFIVVGAGISTFVSPFLAQPFLDDSLASSLSSPPSSSSSSSSSSCSNARFPTKFPPPLSPPRPFVPSLYPSHESFPSLGDVGKPSLRGMMTSTAKMMTSSAKTMTSMAKTTTNTTTTTMAALLSRKSPPPAAVVALDAAMATMDRQIKWPFIIVGCITAPAALAFLYFYCTRPDDDAEQEEVSLEISVDSGRKTAASPSPSPSFPAASYTSCRTLNADTSPSSPNRLSPCTASTALLMTKAAETGDDDDVTASRKRSGRVLLFRSLIVLLNVPVFGLLLTFADLLTSVGMTSPLCMTPTEASLLNTVLWGAAMVGRAVSALTLVCVPMFLQLLLCAVCLVATGTVLTVGGYGNALVLWFGTAGVGLFATPSMPGFIAWSGDYVPITPAFMSVSLCAAGAGEMLIPFVGGQLMAVSGIESLMLFATTVMVFMLVLFLLSYYVARKIDP